MNTFFFTGENTYTLSVVTINLKNENFVPGKKNYERTRIALKRLKQSFDVVVLWDPPSMYTSPFSYNIQAIL